VGSHSGLCMESCGASVLDEATVLKEGSVIVGATVLKARVLVETYVIVEAVVLVAASCSEVYAEVCMTLGHEVGPALAIVRRALRIVSNPYVSISRAVISIVIACGGFFPLSSLKFFLCQALRIA
jgi:hypothetical protein